MNKSITRIVLIFTTLVTLLPLLQSCDEEVDGKVSVLTEDVFFVGSDKIRVLARVIGTTSFGISDHGFEVSTTASFNNPIRVSLGDKAGPGRFISEITGLNVGTAYYVRSFMNSELGDFVSEPVQINTLTPLLSDFSPKLAFAGTSMNITGANFTKDTKVFFGDVQAQISDIDFESIIRLRVPPISNSILVPLKVVNQNVEMVFSQPFEYIVGKFSPVSIFPFDRRLFQNVGFVVNNQLVVGLGITDTSVPNNRIWRYNLNTSQWSEVTYNARSHINGFSSAGYFGGGAINGVRFELLNESTFNRDFWFFDGQTFQAKAQLPFRAHGSYGFSIGDHIYVVGGSAPSVERQMYRYSKSTDTWELLPNAPYSINNTLPSFTHNNRQYFVLADKRLVEYTPSSNLWRVVGSYPGSNVQAGGVAIAIGNRAYVGMYRRENEIWELSLIDFTWKEKTRFTGDTFVSNAAVYALNNQMYILRSKDVGSPTAGPMELIRFEPDGF